MDDKSSDVPVLMLEGSRQVATGIKAEDTSLFDSAAVPFNDADHFTNSGNEKKMFQLLIYIVVIIVMPKLNKLTILVFMFVSLLLK